MTKKYLINLILILSILILIPSCAINPVTGKRQLMLMSEAQEVALGAQYDPTVISTFGEYHGNPELLKFITEEGTKMGKISHRPKITYHFRILDSPVVNAFAVPGGYIYLTRGILAQFNNEAELMGVLGHEMGHINARHSASQQSKQQLGQLLLVGGMIVSEDFRQFADYAMQGMQLLFLKFSRDNEREADRLGVEYSSKLHYDAHKMADFFNVLNKMQMASSHDGVPTFLSTHPNPVDRFNTVNKNATRWQDSLKYSNWTVNREEYLQMIDGLVYGEDPRQGFVEGNTFYHPELKLKFNFPQGWQLQNSPMQIQMVPKDGKAVMLFFLAQQKTIEEAGEAALKALNLDVLESKRTTVKGLPAIYAISQQVRTDQQTGQKQIIKVLSYIIQKDDRVYVFHGVSEGADFNNYAGIFKSTMNSFSKLTDPSKLNIKPVKIKIRKVQKNSTLADIFNFYKIPKDKYRELALLNEMELTDIVKKGELIKVTGR